MASNMTLNLFIRAQAWPLVPPSTVSQPGLVVRLPNPKPNDPGWQTRHIQPSVHNEYPNGATEPPVIQTRPEVVASRWGMYGVETPVVRLPNRCHTAASRDSSNTDTSHMHSPPPESPWSITFDDHTKVKISDGFMIQDVTTSVETPWVILSDIPARVKEPAIRALLARFGSVQDVKFPAILLDVMIIRVRFSTHAEALHASAGLDGLRAFGTRITARIPVNARNGMTDIQDSTVRIQWKAPSKVAYGGYPDHRRAQEAISATRVPLEDYLVQASIYVGLPSVGPVTVKFSNLPPRAAEESMRRFSSPDDVMWERPNYSELEPAVSGVRRMLQSAGDLRELDVLPPPYSHGVIRAYATFSSPSVARSAAASLNGRTPPWTGKTRIFAHHVQTLIYRLSLDEYHKDASRIENLRETAFLSGFHTAVAVRPGLTGVVIRLSAESMKALGWLKAEFEAITRGETIRQDGVAVWDSFFGSRYAAGYLSTIRASQPDVRIHVDSVRRIMRLFGTAERRAHVRRILLQKMADLKSRRLTVIRIPGRAIEEFIATHLARLRERFGAENIFADMWQRTVTLRGGDQLFEAGTDAIHDAQQSSLARLSYRPNLVECPVCFNEVVSPVTLLCGHTWCRACFAQYLLSAVESRRFPLKCLGDEVKCTESIPLSAARSVLQSNEFNQVVEAALANYVHTHAKELHYCPSSDCSQIHRTGPKGAVVQCPSCLLRICPHCHAEAHDGFECADRDGGDKLFKDWAAQRDVKNCPGCDIPIERDEGCHHVTCIQCRTHICWFCLKTFPEGEGIYKHMRTEHGGI